MKKRAETLKSKAPYLVQKPLAEMEDFLYCTVKRRLSPTVFPHWLYHTVKDL